jgi:hypothetical protein
MEMQYPDCIDGPELLTMNLVCNTSAFLAGRVKSTIAAMNITEKLVNVVEYLDFPQFLPHDADLSTVILWGLREPACYRTNDGAKLYMVLPTLQA